MRNWPRTVVPDPGYDLIIVGAGPAGLSAALIAADNGLTVALVDEQHDLGGQIMRQSPATFHTKAFKSPLSLPGGKALLEAVRRASGVDFYPGATAWGVFHKDDGTGVRLPVSALRESRVLVGRHLLLATGAYDLPVAFPGWTIPGVMTAGGVQTLLKSQFLKPGSRFVLAGSHPLLLLVADLLLDAGAQIAEVAVARPLPSVRELLGSLRAVPGHFQVFAQIARILLRLRRHRVPVRFGSIVKSAEGVTNVNQITISRVDRQWNSIPDTERVVAADTLVMGYGLLASSELGRQAGCAVRWMPERGGWIVEHDKNMKTSVERVLVAGEPAGVKGAELSALEGQLAALTVVRACSPGRHLVVDTAAEAIEERIASAAVFSEIVLKFFAPSVEQMAELVTEDTIVCRCENITRGDVHRFLESNPHVSDISSVKLGCRTGMGYCQGRYCQHTVASITAKKTSRPIESVGMFSAQVPIKPVPIHALICTSEEKQPENDQPLTFSAPKR